MDIALQQIPIADLHVLAKSGEPEFVARVALEGALPPDFVARRAIEHLAQGKQALWCNNFYIVGTADDRIVGSCGFKDSPSNGRVEIGYGVATSCRGQGIATAAVRELLCLASASGHATEVLAEVSPENTPSIRVVRRLGFKKIGERINAENELVLQWLARPQQDHSFNPDRLQRPLTLQARVPDFRIETVDVR
ncbi:MAG: GNAT family N-acetyltransferase, partial [Acidobacteriota bacterium]